jgi:hypothetical protein
MQLDPGGRPAVASPEAMILVNGSRLGSPVGYLLPG